PAATQWAHVLSAPAAVAPSGGWQEFTISTSTDRLPARAPPGRWCGAAAAPARSPARSPRRPRAKLVSPRLRRTPSIAENGTSRAVPPMFSARRREATTATLPTDPSVAGDTPLQWQPTVPLPISRAIAGPPHRNVPAASARRAFFQSRPWFGPIVPSTFRADDSG